MSIRHFRIFIAVAEEENITKAAKKLYLTQPTVSVAIKEIEEHYGARFFERINQRLHITEEGKRFLDYAKHFIAMYDEMEIAFKNTDFTGRLRVGASVNIGTYYIPKLIREFQDRYPGINVQVKINTTAVVEKELLDGRLDLALVGGTIQSEHIVAEPLFYEKYTAICAPEHPMAGKTVPLEEFMKEPLLLPVFYHIRAYIPVQIQTQLVCWYNRTPFFLFHKNDTVLCMQRFHESFYP